MINSIIVLTTSIISGFAYYKLIAPPENWLTYMVLSVTWTGNLFAVITINTALITQKPPLSISTLQLIREYIPISTGIIYILLISTISIIQYNFNYIITSFSTGVVCMSMLYFVMKYIILTPETVDTITTRREFLNEIIEKWEKGKFSSVHACVRQCSHKEVSELTTTIIRQFGIDEAELFQRLL